jgi:hypothetical protein
LEKKRDIAPYRKKKEGGEGGEENLYKGMKNK